MDRQERYDAFISYRHCKPDSDIVDRLHKKLENYRLPKDVAKQVGKSRLERVFRDDAELSVSADLSEEITKAILNSEYLIVVCSPEYLKSEWCRKELEMFLEHSDRNHVLLVLADGEPEDSFPKVMLDSEPLAADCRGNTQAERNSHIDKAVVRLVAAIFGVGYDDLMQRHRHEANMRWIRRAVVAFSILLMIIGICVFFLVKISNQNQIITQKYNDTLAATSTNLLADGRRLDAIYAARLALPDKKTDTFSESATQALVQALGIYDASRFSCDKDIMIPCSAGDVFVVSSSGKYVGVSGLDSVCYVLETDSNKIVYVGEKDSSKSLYFDGDRGFLYNNPGEDYKYFDLSGQAETDVGFADAKVYSDTFGNGYAFVEDKSVSFYKGVEPVCIFFISQFIPDLEQRHNISVDYSPDGKTAYVFVSCFEKNKTYGFAVDLAKGDSRQMNIAYDGLMIGVTTDGKKVVWAAAEDLSVYVQDIDLPNSVIKTDIDWESVGSLAISGDDIAACSNREIIILNSDLLVKDRIITQDLFTKMYVSNDGIVINESGDGIYLIKDGESVNIRPAELAWNSKKVEYSNGTIYLMCTGDNFITTYTQRNSDYLIDYEGEINDFSFFDNYENVTSFKEAVLAKNAEFDANSIYETILCENADIGIIQLWDGVTYVYDSNSLELIKIIHAMEGPLTACYYDEAHKTYYISAKNTEVYNKDFKKLYIIEDCQLSGLDKESGSPVVTSWTDEEEKRFLVKPVTYEEIIRLADKLIGGYEPDERVREKYSLGKT